MKKFEITDKNKKLIGITIFAVVILFAIAVSFFIGKPLVKFASNPEKFRVMVEEFGFWSRIIYIFMLLFQVIFALIPGEPFEILAGYAFGAIEGSFLCLLASVIGSTIVFLLARKLGVKFVELFFSKDKINSLKILHDKKKMYYITFLVFFIPGTPKDLLSYVAGLTPIKLLPYLILTTIAKIPSIITSTIGGDAFGEEKYLFGIITFLITGLISFAGLYIYNKITNKK